MKAKELYDVATSFADQVFHNCDKKIKSIDEINKEEFKKLIDDYSVKQNLNDDERTFLATQCYQVLNEKINNNRRIRKSTFVMILSICGLLVILGIVLIFKYVL